MAHVVITIIAFLSIIAGLVIAHELGHFAIAKAFKVRVEEFGIGFPPRLFSVQRGETRYSLNAVPLGGFTKMAGEEDPNVARSLASKKTGVRILVLSAGSLMNLLLPVLLFSIAFMVPHDAVIGDVVVEEVTVGSPASISGVEVGDLILSVNGKPVRNINDLEVYTYLNLGEQVEMEVKHSDSTIEELYLTPRWTPPEGEGSMGFFARLVDYSIVEESYPPWQAIPMGFDQCVETFSLFKKEIMSWFILGAPPQVAGPVGIAQMVGEVARAGMSPLLRFAAFLSINLAIINILPLPALDGGRITFVILERLRKGKRVSPKTEGLVHLVGFVLLIAVIMIITYQDVLRIMNGQGLT